MPKTILVQSPVVDRTNQNHSHGRVSWTVYGLLVRFLLLRFDMVLHYEARKDGFHESNKTNDFAFSGIDPDVAW